MEKEIFKGGGFMDKELREVLEEIAINAHSRGVNGNITVIDGKELDQAHSAILKLFKEREDVMGKEIIKLKEDLKKCHDCDYYCLSLQQEVQYLEGVAESFATEVKYYKERENIHLNFAKEVIQRKEKNG
jgi:hypothetical protein